MISLEEESIVPLIKETKDRHNLLYNKKEIQLEFFNSGASLGA
jgi:hypothetical protein